ncbi:hypothetical protein PsorP6_008572 [Peronosclerospora sorghi]|uniref:Uncharacterized protein n=1 Tax=Peronosclerospora sorghi TaxID=230839 RepID=A0ACC0W7Z3_9STRA|nr:hypothetical protein PsorP6_008572 [Peronosclerospora sorghi]
MRVALGIHKTNISAALEMYEIMSQKFFTHATPTLFNAGTPRPQLSSFTFEARVGLRMFEWYHPYVTRLCDTAQYLDQGGGKRIGSFAIYLEPWHADVLEFLELRKNHGNELHRARDLFYALWIPDLFM